MYKYKVIAMVNVFIDGAEGTTGLRINERLLSVSNINLLCLSEENRKDEASRKAMAQAADIIFLCLPDDAARRAVELYETESATIIDASSAHRIDGRFAYGFPELSPLHKERIAKSKHITVPGCHASGFIALIYPLVTHGILKPTEELSCFSITGFSGGGKTMIADYANNESESGYSSPRVYATAQSHKHLNEMRVRSGISTNPVFNPVVAPYYSGMLVSVPLHMSKLSAKSVDELTALYSSHYGTANENCGFVRVLPPVTDNVFLSANAISGFDYMELFVAGNEERVTLHARFDNLGKGASGAAIQCMNIVLGWDEKSGLTF